MREPWTPTLRLDERGGRCRLSLVGLVAGEGATLQGAADDLVARVTRLAAAAHLSGFAIPVELGPPDLRLVAFVCELGGIVARGGDVRHRLFGCDSAAEDLAA